MMCVSISLTALSKKMGKLSFIICFQQEVEAPKYCIVLHVRRFRVAKPVMSVGQRKGRTR
jgi:hypothetical protein